MSFAAGLLVESEQFAAMAPTCDFGKGLAARAAR
jgi:hypothetical protein